ncbi:MAG: domain S-box protein [Firmicutes bacterium]|nr:domain S-box protein [Bacillota bacterium]
MIIFIKTKGLNAVMRLTTTPETGGRPVAWLAALLALVCALMMLYMPYQFQISNFQVQYPFLRLFGLAFGVSALLLAASLAELGLPRWVARAGTGLLAVTLTIWLTAQAASTGLVSNVLINIIMTLALVIGPLRPRWDPWLFRVLYSALLLWIGGVLVARHLSGLSPALPIYIDVLFLVPGLLQIPGHYLARRGHPLGWVSLMLPVFPFAWLELYAFQAGNWYSLSIFGLLALMAPVYGIYVRRPWNLKLPGLRRRILALALMLAVVPTLGAGAIAVSRVQTYGRTQTLATLSAAVRDLEGQVAHQSTLQPVTAADADILFQSIRHEWGKADMTPVVLPLAEAPPAWSDTASPAAREEMGPDGKRRLVLYVRRPDLGLLIAVTEPAVSAYADAAKTAGSMLLGSLLVALLAVTTAILLSSWITGHLAQLQTALAAIGARQFRDHGLGATGDTDDELSVLATAVTTMAATLEANHLEIHRQHAELQAILSVLPVGVAIADRDGRLQQINLAAQAIAGISPSCLLATDGRPGLQGWWPASGESITAEEWPIARALKQGETTLAEEIMMPDADGGRKVVLTSTVPIHDEAGAVAGAATVMMDITERKQMEEALRTSEAILAGKREVFEQISIGTPLPDVLRTIAEFTERRIPGSHCAIFLLDETGGSQRLAAAPTLGAAFAQSQERILIREGGGVLGPAVLQRQPVIVPDLEADPYWSSNVPVLLELGMRSCIALPILGSGSEVLGAIAVLYRSPPVAPAEDMKAGETATHMAAIAIERHRSDERRAQKLQSLIVHMGEGVIAADHEQRLLFINPAAVRLLGLTGAEEGQPLAELELPETLFTQLSKAAAPGEYTPERSTVEYGEIQVEALVSPVYTELGRYGAIAVLQDVTSELQLRRLQENFIANISHELRAPLASISAGLEAVADGVVPERDRPRYLRAIMAEMGRLRRLSNEVIDLTRLDSGLSQVDITQLAVAPALDNVQEKVQLRCDGAGIKLVVEPTHLAVLADFDRVDQILTNLVENAIRFTPAGGEIRLSARLERGMVRLIVADTGAGIPAEHLPYLWDRFYKVDQARTPSPTAGTGLGLAIVRQLVELMGGKVAVESEPGRGSVFSFTLPVVDQGERAAGASADGGGLRRG